MILLSLAGSAERPSSAISIHRTTRQRLQNLSNRRVYAVEKGLNTAESSLVLDASKLVNSSLKVNEKQLQNPANNPMKNLVVTKTKRNFTEVRLLITIH